MRSLMSRSLLPVLAVLHRRMSVVGVLTGVAFASVACDPPPEEEPVPDCTKDVVVDTTDVNTFFASLACGWPLIADDRSNGNSQDGTLTHGETYTINIADSGAVSFTTDVGNYEFAFSGNGTYEDEADKASAHITVDNRQVFINWLKADNEIQVVFLDLATGGSYTLAPSEPASPWPIFGLEDIVGETSGKVTTRFAANEQAQEQEPDHALCETFVLNIDDVGRVVVSVGDTDVQLPYRPRSTNVTQALDGNQWDVVYTERDGRRLAMTYQRQGGVPVLFRASVQTPESGTNIAEYTYQPSDPACD